MAHLIKFDKEIVSGVLLCATIQLFGFQFNTKLNVLPLEQIQFSDSSTIVASYCHGNSKQTEGLWLNNCFFMSLTHNDFCLQRSTRKYSALVWETRLVKLFCRNTSLFEFWAYTWVTFSRISFFFNWWRYRDIGLFVIYCSTSQCQREESDFTLKLKKGVRFLYTSN